jgi:hypothetical protein
LPLRVQWQAFPSGTGITSVQFIIDGQLGWVEQKTPYFYGDDGNWLVTSFLAPGLHEFTVRALVIGGKPASDTVKATTVAGDPPPAALQGSWKRTATPSEITAACTSDNCPPPGAWQLNISAKGWSTTDPQGGSGLFDVVYVSGSAVQMRPTIEYPPFPNSNNGGWCGDVDPLATYGATVSADGKSLNLRPSPSDPCGDRLAILRGMWTRVSST